MTLTLYILLLTAASYSNPQLPALQVGNEVQFPGFTLYADETTSVNKDTAIKDDWFGMDKFWHWSMSFALVGASYHLTNIRLGQDKNTALLETVSFAIACSIAKEFYDVFNEKHFSFKDLVYDALGIITGYFVFIYP